MKGFRDFIMRGNLVELAVAFIMAAAFGEVVKTFTQVIMDLIGKIGGVPNFSSFAPEGISIGVFLTALVSFLVIAFVVYFFVVKPYEILRARIVKPAKEEEPAAASTEDLLAEIRDLLKRDNN